MPYLIGLLLAVATAGFAAVAGFDRDRTFYPTVLIVVAAYYVLFAAMEASPSVLLTESFIAGGFLLVGVLGFRTNLWLVVVALAAHGTFDLVHHRVIDNAGVPPWWPAFCLAFDVTLGGSLALLLTRRSNTAQP